MDCPAEQHITFTVFTLTTNHTNNKPSCHVTLTENPAGYAGFEAKNVAGEHMWSQYSYFALKLDGIA